MRSSVYNIVKREKSDLIKQVIIECIPPEYNKDFDTDSFDTNYKKIVENLDKSQVEAIYKSFSATTYHLINGADKSGKTTTLAALIEIYKTSDLKVLVVAKRHNILDNLLVKLVDKWTFVRIAGSNLSVHDEIKEYVKTTSSFRDSNEIEEMMEVENIYAATCLSCQNNLLTINKPFDVCIIEDATEILEPQILCAIDLSKKFIMTGDLEKYPTIENKKAKKEGFKASLFHRLAEPNDEYVSHLKCTYLE